MDGVQLSQGYRIIMRRQFTFTTEMSGVSGTHLTRLRRMKGWVEVHSIPWFLNLEPLDWESNGLTTIPLGNSV